MSDPIKGDQLKIAADRVAGDIMAKVNAISDTKPNREEVREIATRAIEDVLKNAPELLSNSGAYRPEDGSSAGQLRGTVWGRMGLDIGDVELAHDILAASQAADPRRGGPLPQTRAIVEKARKARAHDSAESGFGAELVADAEYVPQIWDSARATYGQIMNLVDSRPMSGPVEKQPVLASIPDMIFVGEATAAASDSTAYGTQKVGSNEVTLTAKKFLAHYNWSGEMEEDSIVPWVGLLREALAASQARTMDKLLLNGDTTNAGTGNINLDDADPTDTLYYLAADGIRHAALVDNTANTVNLGGALTYQSLLSLLPLMMDRTYDQHWGREGQPVFVGTPELDNDLLNLDEIVNAAASRGMLAELPPLRGEVARIAGRYPYISSMAMAMTEADGKLSTTGSNNTLGQVVCFNPAGLVLGVRRAARIEVERIPRSDQWAIILSTRVAVGRYTPTGAASGIEWAACLRNITNS